MIAEIFISNYKSIHDQHITLGRVNVLYGRKGSGKTNIIEAIGMAAAAHDDALDTGSLLKRGIRAVKPSLTFHASPLVQNQSKAIEISWYEKNSWKKTKLVCDDTDGINALWKDVSWYDPEYVDKMNNLIKFIGDGSIEENYPFADEAKNTTLNAAFRGSRNFRDFVIYNADTDAVENTDKPDIYGENLLALIDSKQTPSIFAIDDIEKIVAPEQYNGLIRSIAMSVIRNNKQAYITASEPEIVKGLDLADPEQKLFLVKTLENGQTVVEKITDMTLINL